MKLPSIKLTLKQKEFLILVLIIGFSLFLRIYFPYKEVFSEPIKYSADDGVYHMRLIENMLLGGHFPHRLYFDAFTNFPYGTYIHFAPLYEGILATFIWLFSLGKPTLEIINKVSPFYPAVLGGLTVLVIYFIGKILWGRKAGLISAFLMGVFPPFLYRSLLGVTDHHQAEVLFSSLTILFLILTYKSYQAFKKEKFWLNLFLTGISLGCYFLVWNGTILFLAIIFLSIIIFFLIEYYFCRPQYWILKSGIIIFSIALIMLLPFLGHPDIFHSALYDIRHYGSLIIGILSFLYLWWLSSFCLKKKIPFQIFISFLFFSLVLLILFFQIISPLTFQKLLSLFKSINIGMVSHDLARELVAEMAPLGPWGAFEYFGGYLYLALIGFGFIFYYFYKEKEKKPENVLIIIWFLSIFLVTGIVTFIGQNRFSYYFSACVALISSYLIVKAINFILEGFKCAASEPEYRKKIFLFVGLGSLIFGLAVFILYPFPFNLFYPFPYSSPKIISDALNNAKSSLAREEDFYETLKWLKENSPDPGLDYYALYEEPKYDPALNRIKSYHYPETAYGVLSSWDIGHMITYYAHRIPVANPFQQGIGRMDEELGIAVPGEASFFIENEEEKAIKMLDELKTKYIVTDYGSAVGYGAFMGKTKWALGDTKGYYLEEQGGQLVTTRKYDKSMIVRLHYFDGREWKYKDVEESYVKYLDHFRLVYESKTSASPSLFDFEKIDENNNIRLVKIFEYVKGAKIIGFAPSGTKVKISTKITTNQGRKFTYEKSTISQDGKFEFLVPYSTEGKNGWLENGTKFEVFAEPYEIKIGEKIIKINVKEKDIISGNSIYLNK
ncbi:MAG: oligosaccharyl transferase, archaeosortase A system-associated [Minisyncoccia bacterium]